MSKTLELLRDGNGQPEKRTKYFGTDPTNISAGRVLDTLVSFEPNYLKTEKASEKKHPAISGFDMALAAVARLRGVETESRQEDNGLIPVFDENGDFVEFTHRPFTFGLPKPDSKEHADQELEEISRKTGFLYGLSVLSRDNVFDGAVNRIVKPADIQDLEPSDNVMAVLGYGSKLLIAQTLNETNTQAFEMGYYGTFPSNFVESSAFTIVDSDSNLGIVAATNSELFAQSQLVA